MIDDENMVNCQSTKKTKECTNTAAHTFKIKGSFTDHYGKMNFFFQIDIKFKHTLKKMSSVSENCYGGYLDVRNKNQRDKRELHSFTLHEILSGGFLQE
jgi:hypothetical protein